MGGFHKLLVSEIVKETPNSVSISFEIPESIDAEFKFKAGQYITIKHFLNGSEIRRSYSICSSPREKGIRVGVKKVPNGNFSVFANTVLQKNDILEIFPPEGKFILEPKSDASNNYLFFAAGSGITPIISIIKSVLIEEPNSSIRLVFGNQSKEETMFFKELEDLQDEYSNRFYIEYIFSRKKEENALFGRIDRSTINYIFNNKFNDVDFSAFYLCGPEPMINEVTLLLIEKGFSKEQISFELFNSTEEGEPLENHDGDSQIEVLLDDESTSFIVPKKRVILESALKEGLDAPYSCQGGICSTCIARLKEGKVEMIKNQILTDEELAEGLILTCQSLPLTSKIVVDYDDV